MPVDSAQVDSERRRGMVAGVVAYLLWGVFPLYWHAVSAASALEILAHRIVWSLVSVVVVLMLLRTPRSWLRSVFNRRKLPRMAAASILIAVNWLTYIWGVNAGYVVETSLGYFINPLFNVVVGVLAFGERLGRLGRIGVALAAGGVVVIAWESWRTLWISLLLTVSFGLYGAAKKRASLPALQGLAVESGLLAPLAVAYLAWLGASGGLVFGTDAGVTTLLMVGGPVTLLPLWLFAVAAPRIPFGVVGILQYVAPTIQFLLGITFFGQHVVPSYWAGLVLVWVGSAAYLTEAVRRSA